MNEPDRAWPLAAPLHAAAQDLRAEQPPADLLARIRARVPARRAGTPRRITWSAPGWALAGLGTACAALLAVLVLAGAEPVTPEADLWASGFVPVAGSERWQQAAEGGAWLVPVEWPRARLAALGLPYDSARAAETVRAQVLLHSSGDVLAVRVVD